MNKTKPDWITQIESILNYIAINDINEDGTHWKPDWNDFSQAKYYIVCSPNGIWNYSVYNGGQQYGAYMSLHCAIGLVDKLMKNKIKI